MTAERNLGFFIYLCQKEMKNLFLEALRPCCSFSYEMFRRFVKSIEFSNESDRKKVLKEIKINGLLTRKGWILLYHNISFENELTGLDVKEWLGDCYTLNCEQWILLVENISYTMKLKGFENVFIVPEWSGENGCSKYSNDRNPNSFEPFIFEN